MHTRSHAATAPSNAGLILSLVDALPNPFGPLARRARAVAAYGSAAQAGDVLVLLLDATDAGLAYDEDGLLDEGFDA